MDNDIIILNDVEQLPPEPTGPADDLQNSLPVEGGGGQAAEGAGVGRALGSDGDTELDDDVDVAVSEIEVILDWPEYIAISPDSIDAIAQAVVTEMRQPLNQDTKLSDFTATETLLLIVCLMSAITALLGFAGRRGWR